MIEVKECSKAFGTVKAVNKATLDVGVREVFGLVGSNGAGKSTLLRMMAGIIRPDEGEIQIDGMPVYENEEAKKLFFYISDDSYFPANYTAMDLVRFYRNFYPQFRTRFFHELMEQFHLEEKTFDGLDPVMRQAVKSLFASEIMNREFTPVIASHNLRELEDICDHVGLLHKGGILLSKDLEDMKFHIHKIQCVLSGRQQEKELEKELQVLKVQHQGSLLMITARGTRSEIIEKIQAKNPLFMEVLPLTLEEIFISETEVAGYEIKNLF